VHPVQVRTIDGWTLAHFATGVALAAFRISRPVAYAIIIGTEIVEFFLRRIPRAVGFFGESQQNIAADLLFSALGFELVKGLRLA